MRTSVGGEIPKERKAVRPTVQVFLFANPKSGDRRGRHLIDLEVQHFRLKESPEVQIQIYNILDQTSREEGMRLLKYILHRRAGEAECEVHVWSAGGDGTVTSVLDLLLDPHWDIDPSEVFFSCIPFGTGNDFSQVLGWGRTVEKSDVLGKHLEELARIASSRVTNADSGKAYMDIWEVDIATYPNGRLRRVGAPEDEKNGRLSRRMTNYFTIGVQGYVGRGFEGSRARSRFANACIYARESMKWLIFRKFPPVTRVWSGIQYETVLTCPTKEEMELVEKLQGRPTLLNNPIEVVVQNIPHIWGRNVDLWGDSPETADTVMPQQGPTDPSEWTPQTASDGKLEIFSFSSVWSYIKKLGLRFDHLSRVGQFGDCELTFRQGGTSNMGHWVGRRRRHEKVTCFMIDGEFYEVKDPKYVRFRRNGQIRLVGNSAEAAKARLVRDTRCEDLHAASLPINLAHLASGAGRNSASPASSSHAHHPSMENPIAIPALIDNEGQPVLPFDPNHMDSHDGGSSSS
ncbi:MAG: ATP-NAD kinase-like domain-containing protein [Piptocephalis tieghemiana]|nr:MAG: ATP-NAD kinase-like domain-containing protein [Piptocephalis tieghemiana]